MRRDRRSTTRLVLVTVALVGALAAAARAHHKGNPFCDAVRCSVQARIDAVCPCAAFDNHGRYVSCVAHAAKALRLQKPCKGEIVSCAARSTCGKPGAVVCVIGTSPAGAFLPNGIDDHDHVGGRCFIAKSGLLCERLGGRVGPGNSCCPECPSSPSGAFLND